MLRRSPRRLLLLLAVAVLVIGAPTAGHGQAGDEISTVAGSGFGGFAGDGAAATAALLTSPSDLALVAGGGFLVADSSNHRIRRVAGDGVITTVAGSGPCCGSGGGFAGDGGPADGAAVRLSQPRGVAALDDGSFLIADTGNHRIRRVSATGTITTVAGTGNAAATGDGGPATTASLNAPGGVAALPGGAFLIADTGNNRIRRVDASGTITMVAGNFTAPSAGFSGDGGSATSAQLNAPARVVPLTGGGFLIADTGNDRIRRVSATGTITTVAGSATPGPFAGDGGPATSAALAQPEGVAVGADGRIVIADSTNERVREVGIDGVIRTIAGTGVGGYAGDGSAPTAAQLSHPRAVALTGSGPLVADSFNHRVRSIGPPTAPPIPLPPTATAVAPSVPLEAVPPGASPPVVGRSAVVVPVDGTVLIRRPGSRRFVRLERLATLPLRSEIDTTDGRVSLIFATTKGTRTASAVVSGGRFLLRQPRATENGQRPGELVLSGPLRNCVARRPSAGRERRAIVRGAAVGVRATARARKRRRKPGRKLTVDAQGKIKTTGQYGAAIVRGTRWTITDRCPSHPRPGTFVAVARGRVAVRSFVLHRSRVVPAGQSLLAPARRPR